MKYAVMNRDHAMVFQEGMGEYNDDLLYGWATAVLEEQGELIKIRAHCGTESWAYKKDFILITGEELAERNEAGRTLMVTGNFADVREAPGWQALKMIRLPRGAFVEYAGREEGRFTLVRLLDGRTGYATTARLGKRKDSDGFLLAEDGKAFLMSQKKPLDDDAFKKAVIDTAYTYLGTQYRWGGKTPDGIDCSGFVFMSFMLNGYLLPRRARPDREREIREVAFEDLKPGDTVHFVNPAHIAIYLGGGLYIHSTSRAQEDGVQVSSFDPADPRYLPGLRERIVFCGRI